MSLASAGAASVVAATLTSRPQVRAMRWTRSCSPSTVTIATRCGRATGEVAVRVEPDRSPVGARVRPVVEVVGGCFVWARIWRESPALSLATGAALFADAAGAVVAAVAGFWDDAAEIEEEGL